MQDNLQAIVTVLALVNPVMCGAIFVQIEGPRPVRALLPDATKAALAVLVILVLAALFGANVLHLFGVSLDAFSVAGGGVLSWIGFSMLRGSTTDAKDSNDDGTSHKASLTPLIIFAASPGTITGVITLAVAHTRLSFPVTALVAVSVAVVVMWLAILLVARLGSRSTGGGFVRDTATRFMGLIVIAMGVQFALTGIRAFMTPSEGQNTTTRQTPADSAQGHAPRHPAEAIASAGCREADESELPALPSPVGGPPGSRPALDPGAGTCAGPVTETGRRKRPRR